MFDEQADLIFVLCQRFFGALALRDVGSRADVAQESAVRGETRHSFIKQPPILAVVPAHAVFERERSPAAEAMRVSHHARIATVGGDTVGPAGPQFFFKGSSGQIEPALTHISAELVGIRSPYQHWC